VAKGSQLAQSFCKEIVSCPTPQAHVALNAPTLKVKDLLPGQKSKSFGAQEREIPKENA
jgi:hypothetical protein